MKILGFRIGSAPEIRILEGLEEHLSCCVEANVELEKGIELKMSGERAVDSINRVIEIEEKADNIRRDIVRNLAEGVLPPMNKEDLMRLAWRQDKVCNWAKESAEMLKKVKTDGLSEELKDAFIELTNRNVEAARALQDVLRYLNRDWKKAIEKCKIVENKETEIDMQFQRTLEILFNSDLSTGVKLAVNELAKNLENIGDNCGDTSDLMKVVAVSTFS